MHGTRQMNVFPSKLKPSKIWVQKVTEMTKDSPQRRRDLTTKRGGIEEAAVGDLRLSPKSTLTAMQTQK